MIINNVCYDVPLQNDVLHIKTWPSSFFSSFTSMFFVILCISHQEFQMDAQILKDLVQQKHEMLKMVIKEAAWEKEKCEISLQKLKSKSVSSHYLSPSLYYLSSYYY
jgi:hypothetical protein